MSDFGNTVGDDFDRDSTPDKYIERKEPMTPLEAAQAIIDARARATAGHFVADANVYGTGKYVCCERGAIPKGDRIAEILESLAGLDSNQAMANAIFFALSANHAAAVAQAYIDAEVKIAAIREAFAQWESVRTSRDTDTPEWAVLVALIAALED